MTQDYPRCPRARQIAKDCGPSGAAHTSRPQLLRGRAGINLNNQGGAGKLTLRGSESGHVLVLVDGVRIGSSTSGLVAFQDLPLAMIDRIEIVRSPRSSL